MNQKDQKRQNLETILDLLQSHPSISQADISTRSGLRSSTVSYIARALKERGIVYTAGKGASGPTGGKKADLLSLRPGYGSVGGLVVKNDRILSCVTDFTGQILDREETPTRSLSDGQLLSKIIGVVKRNRARYPGYRATGIAVSSVVSSAGDVLQSSYFSHSMRGVASRIRSAAPELALVVENDANCAAYFDHLFQGSRFRNLVHLHVPFQPFTIGAGIIIDNALYRGARGAAGEIPLEARRGGIEATIERAIRSVAALLDTEAVFISGEFDPAAARRIAALVDRLAKSVPFAIELIDNPEIPVIGASLQAIRLHLREVLN